MLWDEAEPFVDVVTGLPSGVVEVKLEKVVGAFVAVAEFGSTGDVIYFP